MFDEKWTFGGANPQTELFWWDGSFWILDGSSKLWCFEWNGILSIPQVWWRLSPHQEHITHVSSLKTSTKKLKRHKFPTKRRKFPTNRRKYTSSTAQGGGGSFKNRKPIGEVGCCESGMAERSHWLTERWLELCLLEWLQWLQWSPHPQLLDVVWCTATVVVVVA